MLLENGVSQYLHYQATVDVYFPVDMKGHTDCCCKMCKFFRNQSRLCGLTAEVCEYPEKYVGGSCPLIEVTEDEP